MMNLAEQDVPIKRVLVLGGGSAGLLTALTLRRLLPELEVTVLYSEQHGIIGVGEGTTVFFGRHLFHNLQLDPHQFFAEAKPTWKLDLSLNHDKLGDIARRKGDIETAERHYYEAKEKVNRPQ